MKRFGRLAWVAVVAFGFNTLAWSTLEGCSGDDNKVDSGDGAVDQTNPDAKADVAPDVDGGGDVVTSDADADVEAGPDVKAIVDFQTAYAQALCERLASCCYGAQLDAGAPDAAIGTCETNAKSPNLGGIEFAIGEIGRPQVLNSGNINVNQTAATSCLAALQTLSCGQITGTEYAAMAQNCLGALSGKLDAGATGCHGSVECNNGYCEPPDGGFSNGPGTCVPIAAIGQACNPIGGGNDQCMYRGWLGTQQARCDTTETTANTCATTATGATFKCTAKTATGNTCLFEWECASNTCGDSCTCIANNQTWTYPFFGVCPAYFGDDAGLQ